MTARLPIVTQSDGTLSVALSFQVSPGDTFSPSGSLRLSPGLIPEPTINLLLFAGMVMLFGVIDRRRIR